MSVATAPALERTAPRATSSGTFRALLMRDLNVLRKNLIEFIIRSVMQPLLFVFVFTYVFPKIGLAVGGGQEASTFSSLRDLAIISTVCMLTALLMWLTFRSAGPIARRLGPIGLNVVTRVMGILVTATAFGMLGHGIGGLLPGLTK